MDAMYSISHVTCTATPDFPSPSLAHFDADTSTEHTHTYAQSQAHAHAQPQPQSQALTHTPFFTPTLNGHTHQHATRAHAQPTSSHAPFEYTPYTHATQTSTHAPSSTDPHALLATYARLRDTRARTLASLRTCTTRHHMATQFASFYTDFVTHTMPLSQHECHELITLLAQHMLIHDLQLVLAYMTRHGMDGGEDGVMQMQTR